MIPKNNPDNLPEDQPKDDERVPLGEEPNPKDPDATKEFTQEEINAAKKAAREARIQAIKEIIKKENNLNEMVKTLSSYGIEGVKLSEYIEYGIQAASKMNIDEFDDLEDKLFASDTIKYLNKIEDGLGDELGNKIKQFIRDKLENNKKQL